MIEKKIPCPSCEQDYIQEIRIESSGEKYNVCPECEMMWKTTVTECMVDNSMNHRFEAFLEMCGYGWHEVIWEETATQ